MKRRTLLVLGTAIVATLALVGTVFAAANYHWNWIDAPEQGNHWWYNNMPSSAYVTWDADNYWGTEHMAALQYHNQTYNYQYHFENEAYKPPNQMCDRLTYSSASWMNTPVASFEFRNGCGNTSSSEEVKVRLDEFALSANIWYRYRLVYQKVISSFPGDGEVNYSWSGNITFPPQDDWLGKIVINSIFNRLYSDPAGMVN